MLFKTTMFSAAFALSVALGAPSFAGDTDGILIEDSYVRSSTAKSATGAAFMVLRNQTDQDDRLIAVQSDAAKRVELHTHTEDADGVMRMTEVTEGIAIAAGGTHTLKRGGDHIMFMGLIDGLDQGEVISVTLTFEKAGDMTVEIPVDLDR